MLKRQIWNWLIVSLAIVVVDQVSKAWIQHVLQPYQEWVITPFFSLILVFNTGAAFSFLSDASGWQRYFFIILAIAAVIFILYLLRSGGTRTYCAALSLILGGAIGNVWDRLTIGSVVDFILVHYQRHAWPAFNVADSAITVGAVLLIYESFRQRRRERMATSAE